ncbi:DUF2797 domain-containing protein [Streptomyces sp. HNM0663]|uniref:DUF2797 domain-containing protein n=1 Tax=Streptomyces chengmaiensis TaxID=3040919 RepID=A0ABT6HI88_9ACTN|nr:DUF2797 domain-containing protein [Streptomyces chengmaiensis]MDH2388311.1 DUF2797 domain-containing protein [Streptomyces chengmaiensis]
MGWRCAGVRWGKDGAVLRWEGGRESALGVGRALGFRAVGERRCVGARGHACARRAVVAAGVTNPRCGECARLERAHSVAADTAVDDPRTYRVYLAWFGPGMVKVGITAEERGSARLLEQGAVVFSWLGRGPLMAARRTEEVVRAALGVPDRIPYAAKRAARAGLPPAPERAAELAALHRRARGRREWADTLQPLEFEAVDHAEVFGLQGLAPADAVVRELVDGGVVAGTLAAVAGPDLHLETVGGSMVVCDTRVAVGWELAGADARSALTVPVESAGGQDRQEGLF